MVELQNLRRVLEMNKKLFDEKIREFKSNLNNGELVVLPVAGGEVVDTFHDCDDYCFQIIELDESDNYKVHSEFNIRRTHYNMASDEIFYQGYEGAHRFYEEMKKHGAFVKDQEFIEMFSKNQAHLYRSATKIDEADYEINLIENDVVLINRNDLGELRSDTFNTDFELKAFGSALTAAGLEHSLPEDNVFRVVNTENGVEFLCRLDADEGRAVISFYDARYPHVEVSEGVHGQFVSEYYVETLTSSDAFEEGLTLDGGVPNWYLDAVAMQKLAGFLETKGITVEPSYNYSHSYS